MSLSTGTRLGPYEILAPIGAGGMGEVYRARDPRLGREVAIKVLPASFSIDADRLRRFEQEARPLLRGRTLRRPAANDHAGGYELWLGRVSRRGAPGRPRRGGEILAGRRAFHGGWLGRRSAARDRQMK
jgi:hypothetical protein